MMSGAINLEYFVNSQKGSDASVGYLCPSKSEVYKFKFASICMAVMVLCGLISTLVSMATIWLESQASGYGVFAGNVSVYS